MPRDYLGQCDGSCQCATGTKSLCDLSAPPGSCRRFRVSFDAPVFRTGTWNGIPLTSSCPGKARENNCLGLSITLCHCFRKADAVSNREAASVSRGDYEVTTKIRCMVFVSLAIHLRLGLRHLRLTVVPISIPRPYAPAQTWRRCIRTQDCVAVRR
jgi:hypothetical protein